MITDQYYICVAPLTEFDESLAIVMAKIFRESNLAPGEDWGYELISTLGNPSFGRLTVSHGAITGFPTAEAAEAAARAEFATYLDNPEED